MSRYLLAALLALPAFSAILPEGMEGNSRIGPATPIPAPDPALWKDYGFQEAEQAKYSGKNGTFTVTAYRLADSTGAQAAFQILRPAGSKPAKNARLAVKSGPVLLLTAGNYLLRFDGFEPESETLNQLMLAMPRFENAALPALTGFLPSDGRIVNSERYVLGPTSLARFEPKVDPSLAAFQFSTEAQMARYKDNDGEVRLTIFSYPNPQIARDRLAAFQQHPGLIAKRSGPLVAVVAEAASPDAAQRILASVRYEANVTVNQKPPEKPQNLGDMILAIFKLIGVLLVFCTLAGLAFAGFRLAGKRMSGAEANEGGVISLHIENDPAGGK